MNKVPVNLECSYCLRNRSHGGECREGGSRNKGCLIFKPDPGRCIRSMDIRLQFPLYTEIPYLGVWCDLFILNGVGTEVRIKRIHEPKWDSKKRRINCALRG